VRIRASTPKQNEPTKQSVEAAVSAAGCESQATRLPLQRYSKKERAGLAAARPAR